VAAIVICAAVASTGVGLAAPILDDGGTHTISSTSSSVIVHPGTTLQVVDGAEVLSESELPALLGYDAHFRVSGGKIQGASVPGTGGNIGLGALGGTVDITGGEIVGGAAEFLAGYAIGTIDAQVTISGGTFRGGDVHPYPFGSGAEGQALMMNDGTVDISGGTFVGGSGPWGGASAVVLGGANQPIGVTGVITGGIFTPGKATRNSNTGFALVVTGNAAGAGDIDIWGGQFNGEIVVLGLATLDIYGYGLTAVETSSSDTNRYFSLQGVLADGTSLNVPATVSYTSTLNLIEVPEPSAMTMAAITGVCMAVSAIVRRKRASRSDFSEASTRAAL
jgi:hypothetical protein